MTDQILTRNCQLSITERADSSKEGGGNLVLSFPFSSETPYLRNSFFDELLSALRKRRGSTVIAVR